MTIDVYDNQDEDIKKHFRRTNRFIIEVNKLSKNYTILTQLLQSLQNEGKIFIHGWDGLSSASSFSLAYMISHKKMPLKNGLNLILKNYPDFVMNEYFKKQLEQYDLEKLAHTEARQT